MNNRRGFTMVELLGAVVILGILMMVAIPSVSSLIQNSKNKYYISQKKNLESAAKSYYGNNKIILREEGDFVDVSLEELVNKKYISKMVDGTKAECVMSKPVGNNSSQEYTFVRIKKEKNRVTYTSHLYCPAYQDNELGNKENSNIVNYSITNDGQYITINIEHKYNKIIKNYTYQLYKGENNLVKKTLTNKTSKVTIRYDASRFVTERSNIIKVYFHVMDEEDKEFSTWIETDLKDLENPWCYNKDIKIVKDNGDSFDVEYSFRCGSKNGCESTNYKGKFNTTEEGNQSKPNLEYKVNIYDKLTGNESECVFTYRAVHRFTLTYDDNGGSGCANKPPITKEKGLTWGTLCTPQRSGYYFNGWKDGETTVKSDSEVTKNVKAVADWKVIYTIAYNMNNGNNPAPKPTTAIYDSLVSIGTTTQPTKTITFKGNPNSTSGANAASGTVTIGNNTSKAQTFAGWSSSTSAGLGSNAKTGTSTNPGTNWTGSTTANKYFKNLRETIGTVTLTARWTGVAATLPTVTRTGYTCGWNTSSTGNTIMYESGGTYPASAIAENSATTINLYAVCKSNLNITYKRNTSSSDTVQFIDNVSNGANYIFKNVGSGTGQINWTNSGKAFIGWANVANATATTGTWYDEGSTYSSDESLTLYAQWYDIDTLEKSYTTYIQSGDFNRQYFEVSGPTTTIGNQSFHSPTVPTVSGYTFRYRGGFSDFSTDFVYRLFYLSSGASYSVGIRNLRSCRDLYENTWDDEMMYTKDRSATSYTDSVNSRIDRLQKMQDVCLTYNDISTKSESHDNMHPYNTNWSSFGQTSFTYATKQGFMGHYFTNATTNGAMVQTVHLIRASKNVYPNYELHDATPDDTRSNVKLTVYELTIAEKKARSTYFSGKGLARYNALEALKSARSNYFPASYFKVTSWIDGPTVSLGAWGHGSMSKNVSIPNGKLLGVVGFAVNNGTNGSGMSFASIQSAYMSGVNGKSGTVYVGFNAANSSSQTAAGNSMTNVYARAQVLYVSSGSLTAS